MVGVKIARDDAKMLIGQRVTASALWSVPVGPIPRNVEDDHGTADDFAGTEKLEILVYVLELNPLNGVLNLAILSECKNLLQIGVVCPEGTVIGEFTGRERKERDVDLCSNQTDGDERA
jgi:hypothetical protein